MSWTKQATQGAPSARYAHASVVTSNQLFVYGGSMTEGPSKELFALDLHTWIWKRVITQDFLPLYPMGWGSPFSHSPLLLFFEGCFFSLSLSSLSFWFNSLI
jgi:hypothetical protein